MKRRMSVSQRYLPGREVTAWITYPLKDVIKILPLNLGVDSSSGFMSGFGATP